MQLALKCSLVVLWGSGLASVGVGERPIVIAHRGASGYLPEHTLEAKVLAYGMGADYIEQDVVLSNDDVPIVLHDIHLDAVSNVAAVFPERARDDGRYYAVDFSLADIKRLSVTERIDPKTKKAVYPNRFPVSKSRFEVPTLAEELELIQGLNKSTSRNVGIYTEIKSPAWHREQGKDISRIVLKLLDRYGYRDKSDRAYLQCFDAKETRRIRNELNSKLRLVQLVGENDWKEATTDFELLRTPEGIKTIATYADGIGPRIQHIVSSRAPDGAAVVSNLVRLAHAYGLEVHPYTFRGDSLPKYAKSMDDLLDVFFNQVQVDGIFTDFPDQAVRFLNR